MNKKYIEEIQKMVLMLLPEEKRQKKALFLDDCCSELSRLVASWINEKDKSSRQVILKGSGICNTDRSHDILANIKDDRVYLIDPTVWQFFPNENSIFVGEYLSLNEAIAEATRKYSGHWQKSEEIKDFSPKDKDKWLRIVKDNIKESLNED